MHRCVIMQHNPETSHGLPASRASASRTQLAHMQPAHAPQPHTCTCHHFNSVARAALHLAYVPVQALPHRTEPVPAGICLCCHARYRPPAQPHHHSITRD
jgi:hypothetical protein